MAKRLISKTRHAHPAALALAAVLATVLAACGGTQTSGGGTQTSSGAPHFSGKPFKIMVITGINTTINNGPELVSGAQAAAAAINAGGGMGGREVQVESCNHQASASGSAQCARQAMSEDVDDVIQQGGFQSASDPILDAANIPQIGTMPSTPADFQSKFKFPLTAPVQAWYVGLAYYAVNVLHKKRIAGLMLDTPTSASLMNNAKTMVTNQPATWVGTAVTPVGTTDYSPLAVKLKGWDPEVVLESVDATSMVAFQSAAMQFGLNSVFMQNSGILSDDTLQKLPNNRGTTTYYSAAPLPPFDAKLPTMASYRDQMRAAKSDSDTAKPGAISAWLGVWAVKKLADTIKDALTHQTVLSGARTVKNLDLGLFNWTPGASGPTTFPNDAISTVYVLQGVNGHMVLAPGQPKQPYQAWQLLGVA